MYMNCASIEVSGGAANKRETPLNKTQEYAVPELSESATASFPAMFLANIPVSDCTTVQGADVKFPNPGASVENASTDKANVLAPPTGPKCGAASSPSGASSNTQASTAGSSEASGDTAAASSPAAAAPATIFSMSANTPSVAGSTPAPADSSSSSTAATAAGLGTASTGSSIGSCTISGQSVCSRGGLRIGTCTESTVTWIPVAADTKCAGGFMVASKGRRSAKFLSGYFF